MTGIRRDHDPGRAELVSHNPGSLATAPEPARLVAVLGMHRSGTSGVAELLGRNGIDLGAAAARMPATEFNPHGHFEIRALSRFNESVLERLSATWWAPPSMETVQRAAEDYVAEARRFWRTVSDAFAGTTPPLVKDPRLSLLLRIWRHVLPPSTLFVICMRDPLAVARSLFARDQIDIPVGLAIWEMYNIATLQGVMGTRVLFVDVDRLGRSADARVELVSNVRAATGMPPAPDLHDTSDGTLLSSASLPRELNEFLTVSQLSLYQSLGRLPHDVVKVDDLRYLHVTEATLRTIARNRKLAVDSDGQLKARREAEERAGRLDEQLRGLTSDLNEAHAHIAAFGIENASLHAQAANLEVGPSRDVFPASAAEVSENEALAHASTPGERDAAVLDAERLARELASSIVERDDAIGAYARVTEERRREAAQSASEGVARRREAHALEAESVALRERLVARAGVRMTPLG